MAGPGGVESGRLFVRVLPDTSAFARSLKRYLDRIEARTVLRIKTEVDTGKVAADVRSAVGSATHVDTAKLAADIRAAVDSATNAARVQVAAEVDAHDLTRQARRAATVAEKSARLHLPVDIDARSLAGAAGRLSGILTSAARFTVLAAALAGTVGHAANLAAALAPAVGALGAIPALAVGAAAAVGALKLAFSGVGDALSGDPEALARLAPAARAVVAELRAAAPAAEALRRSVQQAVFGPLIGQARELATLWLPLLRVRLTTIGAGFGALFAQLAAGARTPQFITGIDAALHSVGVGVAALQNVAVPVMRALGALVGAFAPAVANTGTGLADLARKFAAFVLAAQQSGQLAVFVDQVGATLRSIGAILLQLGGIISAVFSAANTAGGGLLGNLEQILTTVNAFLSAGQGRTALQSLFSSVSQVLGALLPILTDVVGALGPGIAALLGPTGLTGALRALAPAARPVGEALSALASAVAPLLPLLGAQLANVLTVVAGAVRMLAAQFGPVIGVFAQAGAALARALLPVLTTLVSNGLPAAVALGTALADAFAPLVPVIAQMASMFVSELLPALTQIQATFTARLLPVLTDAVQQIGGALVEAMRQLAPHIPALARAGGELAMAMTQIVTAVVPLVPLLAQVVTWLIGSNALGTGIRVVTVLIRALAVTLSAASVALRVTVGWLASTASWAARTAAAIAGGFSTALGFIRSLPEQIRRVFNGAATWLVSAGRNLVTGLLAGVRQMAARAVGAARDIASSMIDAASDVLGIRSPSRVFAYLGTQTVAGFVHGIDQARPAASQAMAGLLAPPATRPYTAATAGIAGPADLRDPVVNLSALVRIGDGPVIDAVETAVARDPERFAQHVRAGQRGLTRRG